MKAKEMEVPMPSRTSNKQAKAASVSTKAASRSAKAASRSGGARRAAGAVRFSATLLRPATPANADWRFLVLPAAASAKLPSRGQVSVEGTFAGSPFCATLAPDGNGGHWLKVEPALLKAARVEAGEVVALEVAPVAPGMEPEPAVPPDLRKALGSAPAGARQAWSDVTPAARRDWIAWITSAKQEATRARRIAAACDMLASGKRRPCCFDRSGMYGKTMSCPAALEDS
jgi:hypothetical protein